MERSQGKDRELRIQSRRAQLQTEKDKTLREAKEVERQRKQKEEKEAT
jgi:hypothetical protein